ncbi:hypothetical protein D1AOALGA4SA_1019 [Olavius algarvensis Delta 1 endosymbiont]|nr:hypothetical protein D1AOALGA4SA_1019 [Olavius algarvensis Delta 1 endosymbiont]
MSPEKCIVVVRRITAILTGKPTALSGSEGSSPECVMASVADTIGV